MNLKVCDVALGPLSARIFTFSQRHLSPQKQFSSEKPGDICERRGGEFWMKTLPCPCRQPGKCWYWACTGSTCVCQAGIPHTLLDLSHCSLPSTGAKLEGKVASEFALSLGRSLVAALMWLFSVWNRKLVLWVADVLEDGFENNTIFLFVALVPASPA